MESRGVTCACLSPKAVVCTHTKWGGVQKFAQGLSPNLWLHCGCGVIKCRVVWEICGVVHVGVEVSPSCHTADLCLPWNGGETRSLYKQSFASHLYPAMHLPRGGGCILHNSPKVGEQRSSWKMGEALRTTKGTCNLTESKRRLFLKGWLPTRAQSSTLGHNCQPVKEQRWNLLYRFRYFSFVPQTCGRVLVSVAVIT